MILRRSHTTEMKSKVHPTYKTKYRVANWAAYNQALVRRGDVTVWLSSEAIAAWTPRRSGRRDGQRRYSDLAIETALRRCCMNTLWGWGRASWAGCGPDVRRGGQTLIMGYSADKSPLIGHLAGPLRRLEPLVAQRQEKCGPNRPTPTGYSCNNALTRCRHRTVVFFDPENEIATAAVGKGAYVGQELLPRYRATSRTYKRARNPSGPELLLLPPKHPLSGLLLDLATGHIGVERRLKLRWEKGRLIKHFHKSRTGASPLILPDC